MPGRFVYWMNVSVDLKIEHIEGEKGGGDWLRVGESLHRDVNARARKLRAMVQGRRVYEIMEGFWPTARLDESLPDYLREYGEIWTSMPKILVSRTRSAAPHHTRIVGRDGNAVEQLARFRDDVDGDVGVGGATLATHLLRAGLLDQILLYTHPTILGNGRPLFDGHDRPVELDLLEHQVLDEGITLHRYAVRR
ncbi:dihydrofolate reductase family protein [Micromonospora sp. NPDC051300]|uniref:dihydrofolate reductase family protein n=1 Tax=Micromonospora sp. NPDC051300 TaxID=3364286 RepID=UPI0037A1508F